MAHGRVARVGENAGVGELVGVRLEVSVSGGADSRLWVWVVPAQVTHHGRVLWGGFWEDGVRGVRRGELRRVLLPSGPVDALLVWFEGRESRGYSDC